MDNNEELVGILSEAMKSGTLDFEALRKGLEKFGITLKTTNMEYKKTSQNLKDLQESIEEVNEEYEKTSDSTERTRLSNRKTELEKQKREAYSEITAKNRDEAVQKVTRAFAVGTTNVIGGAMKSMASGSDGFTTATGILTGGIDMANNAAQAGAQAMGNMGQAATAAGKKWGLAASIASDVLSGFSSAVSEVAKTGITFLLSQTQKTISSFQDLSRAGAIFAGGMIEMRRTANNNGLTLEQFSKVIVNSKEDFAKAGLTVAGGAKRMAAAMNGTTQAGIAARNSMFSLGLTIEEQAEATAKTMALMAGPTGQLKASNREVLERTVEYAKNLKLISDITGEDVKSKQSIIQKENDTLFMNQKIAAMEPKQRMAFNAMLLTMNANDRQALAEKMKYGQVIDQTLAAEAAMAPGIQKMRDAQFQAVKDGTMSEQKGIEIKLRSQAEIQKNAKENEALALVNSGAGLEIQKRLNEDWNEANKWTKTTVKAAIEANKSAAKGTGSKEIVDAMTSSQRLLTETEFLASNSLGHFNKAIDETITALRKSMGALFDMTNETKAYAKLTMGQKAEVNASKFVLGALSAVNIGGISDMLLKSTIGQTVEESQEALVTQEYYYAAANDRKAARLNSPLRPSTANAASALMPSPTAGGTPAGAASTEAASSENQVIAELKKMNETLAQQSKAVSDHSMISRQILDANHNQLSTQNKTLHAVQ